MIVHKTVKTYAHAHGKQITPEAVDALSRSVSALLDRAIAACGSAKRIRPEEIAIANGRHAC